MSVKLTLTTVRRRLALAATDILARFGWTGLQVAGGLLAAEPVQHWINTQLEARLPLWVFQLVSPLIVALAKNVAAALVGEEGSATFTTPAVQPSVAVEVDRLIEPIEPPLDVSPFAVGTLEPPPARDGVEADSGDATPVDPPSWAT